MRAFIIPAAGSDVVELSEVTVPTIGADELLVEVKAIGLASTTRTFCPLMPSIRTPSELRQPVSLPRLGHPSRTFTRVTASLL